MSGLLHDPLKRRRFRRLVLVGPVISGLSIILLLWVYCPMKPGQLLAQPASGAEQVLLPAGCAPGTTAGLKVPLVTVNGTHTLLMSSYMEHRTGSPEVRVIAVVLRSEEVAYSCLLCCQGQLHISVGDASVHQDHFGFSYGTADIMCPLPLGCATASHVAVSSVRALHQEEGDGRVELPVFLEVFNQEAINDSFPHNFTVCLSTMFHFSNVLQLVQSLEMLRLLGVTKVVVYRSSCSQDTQQLLDHYSHTGMVEVIPWSVDRHLNVSWGWQPDQSPGELHYFGQIPALHDCVYRNMYSSKYLALHDLDELILPQTVESWDELLPLLEEQHGPDFGYMFENYVFPTSLSLAPPTPMTPQWPIGCCPGWRRVVGINILDHLYHEPVDPTVFNNFKIIVNPRAVITVTVHGLLESTDGCVKVDNNIARMYHTRAAVQALPPDQLIYDGRLTHYRCRLMAAVSAALQQATLLDDTMP